MCCIIWFRYSIDPPATGHLALELRPSELNFCDVSFIVWTEWNVILKKFLDFWVNGNANEKRNKNAFSQVCTSTASVWKIKLYSIQNENRISLECKIHIAVFLQFFIKFNKVVYLTLPVWNLQFHTLDSLTRPKGTNSRRTYHGSSHCARQTG